MVFLLYRPFLSFFFFEQEDSVLDLPNYETKKNTEMPTATRKLTITEQTRNVTTGNHSRVKKKEDKRSIFNGYTRLR